jgi:hypothetical protein
MKIYVALWDVPGEAVTVILGRTAAERRTKLWDAIVKYVGAENAGENLASYLEAIEESDEHIDFSEQEI